MHISILESCLKKSIKKKSSLKLLLLNGFNLLSQGSNKFVLILLAAELSPNF